MADNDTIQGKSEEDTKGSRLRPGEVQVEQDGKVIGNQVAKQQPGATSASSPSTGASAPTPSGSGLRGTRTRGQKMARNRPNHNRNRSDGRPIFIPPGANHENEEGGLDLKTAEEEAAEDEDLDTDQPEKIKGGLDDEETEKLAAIEAGLNNDGDDEGDDDEKSEGLYHDEGGRGRRIKGRITRRRKAIGVAVIAAIASTGIGAVLLVFPALRLESYMARINERAFAIAANAVQGRASHLLERYMVNYAVSLDVCGSKVGPGCRADYSHSGIAAGLFNTWRDVRVEDKLLNDYGIKIESLKNPDTSVGAHRFTVTNRDGEKVKLTNGDLEKGTFTGGNRELGKDFRTYLRKETKWYEVMHRRSIRKYMERKHGMKLWCFFFCKSRDNFEVRKANVITRYKYRFVERFVFPFSGKYGLIMNCIIAGGDKCSSGEKLRESGLDRHKIPEKDLNDVVKFFESTPTGKLSQYVLDKLLTRILSLVGSNISSKTIIDAIPVAGQIYLALTIVDILDRMDGFLVNNGLSHFAADINARQYLEYYQGMRAISDEMKSHVLSIEEVGVVMNDFQGAEQSRVYQSYNNPATAVAYGQNDTSYKCDDGKPIPPGEYVCREKKVARTFLIEDWYNDSVIGGLVHALNIYGECVGGEVNGTCVGIRPKTIIHPILGTIDKISSTISGPVIDALVDGLRKTPGLGSIISFGESKAKDLFHYFFEQVFPLPVNVDSPARVKYDGLEAGADVASAEFTKGGYTPSNQPYGLGAPKLSDDESSAIMQEYFAQEADDYKNSSFIARLTNREYPQSFLNKVIAKLPGNINRAPDQLISGMGGMFANIFSGNAFGSLLGSTRASAQSNPSQISFNAFGVGRYGYKFDDPAFSRDPSELTEESCKTIQDDWKKSKTEDAVSGSDEYSVANPCLLEQAAVEAAGNWFINE